MIEKKSQDWNTNDFIILVVMNFPVIKVVIYRGITLHLRYRSMYLLQKYRSQSCVKQQ